MVLADQFILQQATYTLTSQTAAQKLFNSVSNGQVTLVAGTYEFDCVFSLSSMSATSGSFGFALGGTATFTQYWWSNAIATAPTATVACARCGGILVVTVGGTIIPQVSLGVAAAAVVGIGSYFKIRALGDSAAVSSGNWS